MLKKIGIASLAMLSAACVQLPRAELQAYRDAFTAAQTAATPLITNYAIGERGQRQSLIQTDEDRDFQTRHYFSTFNVSDAAAFSTIGNPPGASALERGFAGIAHYNDVLVALADNKNIDVAKAQVQQVISDLGDIAQQPAPVVATAQSAASLLINVLRPAIAANNAAEFRRIVLDGYPHVVELIHALRDFTPTQYSTTTSALRKRWDLAAPADKPAIATQINGWHKALADYVVLLGVMERSLGVLKAAVENPRQRAFLELASDTTGELRVYADTLRRSIAELNAPR